MTQPAPERVKDDLLNARGIVATLRAAESAAEGARGEGAACQSVGDLLTAADAGMDRTCEPAPAMGVRDGR